MARRYPKPGRQARYRPIEDYGVIGDCRSAALVSSDGSIDWWCPGRFDAPSVFGAILDCHIGGRFQVTPSVRTATHRRYLAGTNVIETEHHVETGVVRVVDFAAFQEDVGVPEAMLVRRITGVEGHVPLSVEFSPRFAYGRVAPRFSSDPLGLLARGAGEVLLLEGIGETTAQDGGRHAHFEIDEGETRDLLLRHHAQMPAGPFGEAIARSPAELERLTIERWRDWAAETRYEGPFAEAVHRSALVLKLLHYEPTGAFVAAPTTSLPEDLGGIRNWDYRYAWLRDAAWMSRALADIGHVDEVVRFCQWAARAIEDEGQGVRIMYTIGGSHELPERELPHLEGYRESRPVRVGNGAAVQHQLDVYGELLDVMQTCSELDGGLARWPLLVRLADWVAEHWQEPDSGIWEMRCEPRHFVVSKAMAWVALDRVSKLARRLDLSGDVERWEAEAKRIHAEVLERGWDADKNAFIQAYGFPALDASNLLLPIIGFIEAEDVRMMETVDRTMETLTVNGLVYRYLAEDGLPGSEATFTYCTFWLAEVLAMQGRLPEAESVFEGMLRRASPLGLFAEELDAATGEHMGNYPQGFPHIGLINAARAIERAHIRRRDAGKSESPSA